LAIEMLEDRMLLSGTPLTTLQLLPAAGQSTPSAVTLELNSFQLGFHRQTAGTAASFDELDVTAPYNANAPLLFGQLTTGQTYPSAVLTQKDAGGNTVGVWALSNVQVTDDAITGTGSGLPAEELKFSFGALAQSVGTHIAGWSQVNNSSSSSDIPTLLDPATPAVVPTHMTLDLSGGNATPVSIDLNTFHFGFHNSTSVGPSGVVAGMTSFDELDVTATLSDAGPDLFAALTSGKHYGTATLTQYETAGNPAAVWVLDPAFVTDYTVSGSAGALPTQDVKFLFSEATEATSNDTESWSRSSASASGPALPAGLTLDALPSPATTGLTLGLYTSTAANAAPALTLNLNTFQFGFQKALGAAAVSFDALDVTAGLSDNSPALFAPLAGQNAYARARITQTDAQGNTPGIWALSNVQVTDDLVTGSGTGLAGEELKFAFEGYGQGVGTHTATWDQVTNTTVDLGNLDPGSPAPAPTRITLDLADGTATPVSIDLTSFAFGLHNPSTIGSATSGTGAGKVSLPTLDVTAALSNAAPDLFAALTQGQNYGTATLTQYDAAGNPAAVWVLGTIALTDDTITVTGGGPTTQELKFAFGAVTEATSNNSASWPGSTASGPTLPSGLTLDALPTPAATGLALNLYTSTAATATPVATLNLNTFQFGFHKVGGTVGSSFDALDVTLGLSSNSPALLAALSAQTPYALARITQTDAQGNTTGFWALSNVFVTDDVVTGNGSGLPGEELKFAFQGYGQGVGTHTATWDQVTNTTTNLGNLDPGSPAAAPTRITLDLAGGNATAVNLDLNTFQFVFNSATNGAITIGSGSTGLGAGKVSVPTPTLDVTAALSDAAPDLFTALVNHQHYDTATLTQYDAAGNPAAVWVLAPVSVTDDSLAGSGQTTQELKFAFTKVTEVTNPNQASWDFAGGTAKGPQGPDPSTLDPLAVYSPTVTVSAGPFTYDGTAHAAAATATGLTGDTVSGSITFTYYPGDSVCGTGSITAPTQAGDYTVVAHFSSTDQDYASADSTPLTFNIAKATLTITVNANSKIQGETATDSGTLSGVVNGDGITASFSSIGDAASAAPGKYTISATLSDPNNKLSNYTVHETDTTLTVLSYAQATTNLQTQVDGAGLDHGQQNALDSQLQAAIDSFNRGDTNAGANQLGAFINHVKAQRGKKIDAALADAWSAAAQRIINAVG
jgi:type VI protein secretion system component Hcp